MSQKLNNYLTKAAFYAVLAGLVLFIVILSLTSQSFHPVFNFSSTGQIGDTIGGISAPFIGVSGAILTFLAFYMQFKANETHNTQFNDQSLEKEREKHENKILYLIKQNRDIVDSMSIGDSVDGAKCFSRMFVEYQAAYEIVKSFYGNEIENEEIINISFLIFYNGVGGASDTINSDLLKTVSRLKELLVVFNVVASANGDTAQKRKAYLETIEYNECALIKLKYTPFDGHNIRLGQYFRNLYHILSYTSDVKNELLSDRDKYEIIKSLRSQMSSYEQILIYFNSLSFYGVPLKENGFIKKYNLIKNIPIPLVAFAGDVHQLAEGTVFEWDQIIERAAKYQ